ncbi:MAG: hypothetical protein ACD_9C00284G0001, partial [uncultured bacterium]
DIDGQTRSGSPAGGWDIGADEGATAIYRSVGPSASAALASGTSNALTISGSTATFALGLSSSIGVGDALQYDSDNNGSIDAIAFIHGRTSSTIYTVAKNDGSAPTATAAADNDWAIYRAHQSLQAAEAGTENPSINVTVRSFDTWSGGVDLIANNQQWNIAAYANGSTADATSATIISGWETGPANNIRIYTPTSSSEVGISQRHNGKWSDESYKIVQTSSTDYQYGIYNQESYVIIDGLQIKKIATGGSSIKAITNSVSTTVYNVTIENNIFAGEFSGSATNSAGLDCSSRNCYVFNNIVYGFENGSDGSFAGIVVSQSNSNTAYAYNNTVYGNYYGIFSYYSNKGILKNNISVGNSVDYATTFDPSSTNNLSSDATAPGTNAKTNQTVSFADTTGKDFHLSSNDTAAKNAGADLSADANFAFSIDTDGQTRSGPPAGGWDIGADEGATPVYYSVGQNTNDHKSGSPTLTIASGTGTFSEAQTATNLGVGDKVTYNTSSVAYISQKISTTEWKLITATGATPDDVTDATVNSITHVFASLAAAVNTSTGAGGASFMNTINLYTSNLQLNIPCYYDSGADTAIVSLTGYTTASPNHIKIYTPSNISTEANNSQRHQGRWDSLKYNLSITSGFTSAIWVDVDHFILEGIQLTTSASTTNNVNFGDNSSLGGERIIRNNIIQNTHVAPGNNNFTIPYKTGKIYSYLFQNNVIIGNLYAFSLNYHSSYTKVHIYNNTIANTTNAFFRGSEAYVKNLAVYNITKLYDDYGPFVPSDSYVSHVASNGSFDFSTDGFTALYQNKNIAFADPSFVDYHLQATDIEAKNLGLDLSTNPDGAWRTPFASDMDAQTRPNGNAWDIGADEAANNVFYSVGQTTADLKNGTPTVTIT